MNAKQASLFAVILTLAAASAVAIALAASVGEVAGTVKVVGLRDSANVLVFLEAPGRTPAAPSGRAVMDQKNLTFEPHVLPVVKGAAVDFPNSDKVRHNVYSPAGSAKRFNLGTYPAGTTKTEEFDSPGVVPLLCNVHSEMSGFILVLETPYFATTDKFGRFSIKGVPPGTYRLRTWHEKVKPIEQEITVATGSPTRVELQMSGRK